MKYLNDEEKKFAEILSDVSFDIDTNELWQAVEHKLHSKKRKRKFPFWLSCVAGLLVVGSVLWIASPFDTSQNQELSAELSAEIEKLPSVFDRSAALEEVIEQVVQKREQTSPTSDISDSVILEPAESSKATAITTNTVSNRKSSDKVVWTKPFSGFSQSETGSQLPSRIISSEKTAPSKVSRVGDNSNEQSALAYEISLIDEIDALDHDPSLLAIGIRNFNVLLGLAEIAYPIEVLDPSNSWTPYFHAATGSNLNSTTYTALETDSRVDALASRERSLPGLSSALEFGYENQNGLRFFGGLRHMQLVNQYRNNTPVTTVEEIEGAELFVDENGGTNSSTGTITKTTTKRYAQNLFRLQNMLDVFVGVGKSYQLGEKWRAGANVAAHYNFLSFTKGYHFNSSFTDIEKFTTDENTEFKKTIGVGGKFELNIERRMNDKLNLTMRPFLSTYLNEINKGNHYLIKNSQFGLLVGITYRPY